MKWLKSLVRVSVIAVTSLLVLSSLPAHAVDVPEEPREPANLRTRVIEAMGVLEVARTQANYSGEWFDAEDNTLTVYGVGGPSEKLQRVFDASKLKVEWTEARYSAIELGALADELRVSGLAYEGIRYHPDGSGITVMRTAAEEKPVGQHAELLANPAIEWVEGAIEPADTRTTDTAPFAGGIRIYSNYGGCSGGFPHERDNGDVGIITAWHCSDGAEGVTWKVTDSQATVGKTNSKKSKGWDVQFVKGAAGSIEGKLFSGNYVTSNKINLPQAFVLGGYLPIGMPVSVSGSYSGSQSGKITALTETSYLGGSAQAGKKYYEVTANAGKPLGGNGDSGSPAVEIDGSFVLPVGLYVARYSGSYEVPCKGIPTSSSRKCATVGLVTPAHKMYDVVD
ncbi:MAG: hypothetical protein ACK5LO_14840 [Leucobacter sp.]